MFNQFQCLISSYILVTVHGQKWRNKQEIATFHLDGTVFRDFHTA